MTDRYIDNHFGDIKSHASDVESRLDDSYCTADWLKTDNRMIIEGFTKVGEKVVLIEDDYESTINEVLKSI